VDCIENHEFKPLSMEKLNSTIGKTNVKLATWQWTDPLKLE
jgi:hypothetical protein